MEGIGKIIAGIVAICAMAVFLLWFLSYSPTLYSSAGLKSWNTPTPTQNVITNATNTSGTNTTNSNLGVQILTLIVVIIIGVVAFVIGMELVYGDSREKR
jgi:hypothetical protein